MKKTSTREQADTKSEGPQCFEKDTRETSALNLMLHVPRASAISKKFTSEAKDQILKGNI